MKTIHVTASREYDVVIGAGLLDECGQRIAAAVPGAEKAVVYTDTTVFPLYAKRVADSLKAAGFTVLQDYFLAGEHSKTFRNWERILRFFTENRVSRSDVVVALGGGVVGDMVGFAAACYQRGVRPEDHVARLGRSPEDGRLQAGETLHIRLQHLGVEKSGGFRVFQHDTSIIAQDEEPLALADGVRHGQKIHRYASFSRIRKVLIS